MQSPPLVGGRGVREDKGLHSKPADFDLSRAGESEAAALRGHHHSESKPLSVVNRDIVA